MSEVSDPETSSFRRTMIGIICVALGQLIFATIDAIVSFSKLKESQLLIGRYGVQFAIAVVWWNCRKPPKCKNWYGDNPYILNVWLRGVAFTINTICLYYSIIRGLPLGDVRCIYDQSPLVIAIFAAVFLHEKLPKLTPLICLFAITGIVFISRPSFIRLLYNRVFDVNLSAEPLYFDGLIAAIISLFSWSVAAVLVRAAKASHFLQLEIVSAGQTLFVSIPVLLLINKYWLHNEIIGNINGTDWAFDFVSIFIMIVIGILGFIALSLSVIGFQYGDATKVAWLEYSTIIFAFLYQIFLFRVMPNKFEIIGLILVAIACGLSVSEEFYNHFWNKNLKNKKKYEAVVQIEEDV